MEGLVAKMDAIMKKLEKLDIIETQLKEVHTRMANFEETISRLESEVKDLKKQKKNLEKKVEEFEESLQYNEDDMSDIFIKTRQQETWEWCKGIEEAAYVHGDLLQTGKS